MKCSLCGAEMRRVGLEKMVGSQVVEEWECPACHCRIQKPAVKK